MDTNSIDHDEEEEDENSITITQPNADFEHKLREFFYSPKLDIKKALSKNETYLIASQWYVERVGALVYIRAAINSGIPYKVIYSLIQVVCLADGSLTPLLEHYQFRKMMEASMAKLEARSNKRRSSNRCFECGGSGIWEDGETCWICLGTGKIT